MPSPRGPGVDGSSAPLTIGLRQPGISRTCSPATTRPAAVVNQVEDVYNGLGQLTTEYQATSGAVNTSTTPKVQYAYTRDGRRRQQQPAGQHDLSQRPGLELQLHQPAWTTASAG